MLEGKVNRKVFILSSFRLGKLKRRLSPAQMTFSSSSWEAEVVNHSLHSRNWGHLFNGEQNDVPPLDTGITRLDCQTVIPVYQR